MVKTVTFYDYTDVNKSFVLQNDLLPVNQIPTSHILVSDCLPLMFRLKWVNF